MNYLLNSTALENSNDRYITVFIYLFILLLNSHLIGQLKIFFLHCLKSYFLHLVSFLVIMQHLFICQRFGTFSHHNILIINRENVQAPQKNKYLSKCKKTDIDIKVRRKCKNRYQIGIINCKGNQIFLLCITILFIVFGETLKSSKQHSFYTLFFYQQNFVKYLYHQ